VSGVNHHTVRPAPDHFPDVARRIPPPLCRSRSVSHRQPTTCRVRPLRWRASVTKPTRSFRHETHPVATVTVTKSAGGKRHLPAGDGSPPAGLCHHRPGPGRQVGAVTLCLGRHAGSAEGGREFSLTASLTRLPRLTRRDSREGGKGGTPSQPAQTPQNTVRRASRAPPSLATTRPHWSRSVTTARVSRSRSEAG
jgi:hypothetical protein